MTYILDIRHLNIRYQNKKMITVHDVSLQIKRAKITCLVGESGSGKTSIALALMRMLPPSSCATGEIIFKNINLLNCSEATMKELRGTSIYYLSQNPMNAFNPSIKIGKQLYAMVGKKLRLGKKEFFLQLEVLLKKLQFLDPKIALQQYPFQLSGGMLQRLSFAAAFLLKPDLIIADEPTSSLDVDVQKELLKLIVDSRNNLGITYLIVTHDFGVVAEIADEVLVMKEGKIIEQNDVMSIFNQPHEQYTKELLAAAF